MSCKFNQESFVGGMNLLLDDTRLQPNQYRVGFNLRNRYDVLTPILSSQLDDSLPIGIVQEMVAFGNYLVAFVSGQAYYRFFSNTGWTHIIGFSMSVTAPRYWTVAVPVATTNYARLASGIDSTNPTVPDASKPAVQLQNVAAASFGNLPGLLVQDNISQPQFIFLDNNGFPTVRETQNFAKWSITFAGDGVTVISDKREYVPIGNLMAWWNGVLVIVSQDGQSLFRSVSGRPLDFVVNVNTDGSAGGDATTTSYSVGVGGITCIRAQTDSSLFVAAANAVCFAVTFNYANNAPKEFGEYTFIRTFLFSAGCLSDRCIVDSLGDTKFTDLTGVRSYNAVKQEQNESRNDIFTATIQNAFFDTKTKANIIQSAATTATINFDNFVIFAVNTIFGNALAVYDDISKVWVGFDISQVGGAAIKQLVKLEIDVQRLYAITDDNKLYRLYAGPGIDNAIVRTQAFGYSQLANDGSTVKMSNPEMEIQPKEFRAVINNITQNSSMSITPFINNRLTPLGTLTKSITYSNPTIPYIGSLTLPDVGTQLENILFSLTNCAQGWKCFILIAWTGGGTLTQFSALSNDYNPKNPLNSQVSSK